MKRELDAILAVALKLLLASSVAELILNRVLSRVGVFMPKSGLAVPAYQAAVWLGSLALNLASGLTFVALGVTIYLLLRRGGRRLAALATALAALLFISLASLLAPWSEDLRQAHAVLFFGLVAWLLLSLRGGPILWRLPSWLLAVTYLAWAYFTLAPWLARGSGSELGAPGAVEAFWIGETSATLLGFAVFAAGVRSSIVRLECWSIRALVPGLVISGALAAAYIANSAITATISIWSVGLSLFLPFPLYVASLLLATFTILSGLRAAPYGPRLIGFALALTAGYALQSSYQQLLVLIGALLVSGMIALPANREKASPSLFLSSLPDHLGSNRQPQVLPGSVSSKGR